MTSTLLPDPVTVTITCCTSPDAGATGTEHLITIATDGTFTTPHDLDSERMAVALGGYLTCLELVERTAPVFLDWLRLQRRLGPVPIRSPDQGKRWHPIRRSVACCRPAGYRSPAAAADHARNSLHLARVSGTDPLRLQDIVASVCVPEPERPIGEPWDTLWSCGVHPAAVERINERCALAEPLSPEFYLAVIQHRPNLTWLRQMLAAAGPVQNTAQWLAWSYGPQDRRDPTARLPWLQISVPVRAVVALMEAGFTPGDVVRLAEHWRITNAAAALLIEAWIRQGVPVAVEDLMGSATSGLSIPPRPPGINNILRLELEIAAAAGGVAPGISHADLALAIVEHGSVGAARIALVQRG